MTERVRDALRPILAAVRGFGHEEVDQGGCESNPRHMRNMAHCLVIHLHLIHFFKPDAIEELTVLKPWY
jgi:hypothetical protein